MAEPLETVAHIWGTDLPKKQDDLAPSAAQLGFEHIQHHPVPATVLVSFHWQQSQ